MSFVTADAASVPLAEKDAKAFLTRWREAAGIEDPFPLTTALAADLLRDGGEFAVSADELRRLAALGQVPALELWDGKDILAAAQCLEGRRQWKLTPSFHDPKKGTRRVAYELHAIADDPEALRVACKGFDLRLALVLLTEAENRQLRERCL